MRGKLVFRTFRFISATLFLLTIYYVIIAKFKINNFFKTFNKSVSHLYASYVCPCWWIKSATLIMNDSLHCRWWQTCMWPLIGVDEASKKGRSFGFWTPLSYRSCTPIDDCNNMGKEVKALVYPKNLLNMKPKWLIVQNRVLSQKHVGNFATGSG